MKYDIDTQFSDPNVSFNLFVTCRGIIEGCVIVSSAGIYYKIWISAILGIIGGMVYVGTCLFFKKLKIDDPLHVA
jgi:ammonia channel protein AmtB